MFLVKMKDVVNVVYKQKTYVLHQIKLIGVIKRDYIKLLDRYTY